MKLRYRRSTTRGIIVLACAMLVGVGFLFGQHVKDVQAQAQSGRLITVYDRGVEQAFLSDASTIGAALLEAGFELDPRDAVEPSRDETLVATDYRVNIYRARPVTVVDGVTRQRVMTAYQTPEQIAKDAGITLYEEDDTTLERVDDIIADGAGLQLTIDRATSVKLELFGNRLAVRTQGQTVGELIEEKGIVIGKNDRVEPALNSPIQENSEIRVWREGKQTMTIEEEVPFSTERIYDADRPTNYKEVRTVGVNGLRTVSYEILVENGKEVSRQEIVSIATKQPVTQIEVIGVKTIVTTPTENEAIAWDFFMQQGFTVEQTAGIMGNLMQEHRFKTTDVPGGIGIAQWLGNRRANLLSRPDPFSIKTQLEFIMHEFATTEKAAYRALKAATTVEAATIAFQNKYERCGLCMEGQRIQYAYSFLARYR